MEIDNTTIQYKEYSTVTQYCQYLATPEWRNKTILIKNRDGDKCLLCGETENLVVHHLRYDNVDLEHPGREHDSDLVTLCCG